MGVAFSSRYQRGDRFHLPVDLLPAALLTDIIMNLQVEIGLTSMTDILMNKLTFFWYL